MRRVVGKQTIDLSGADVTALRESYERVLLDVGTGDGKHALRVARQHPEWLVVGLDASRDGMVKASQRAAAKPQRGGQPNVLYVWSAAEQLPAELTGLDEIHVLMPWGSLLRGMVRPGEDRILERLAGATHAGAELVCTLNLHAWRPPVREVGDVGEPTPDSVLQSLSSQYRRVGWAIGDAHYVSDEELESLASAWSRRLNSSRETFDVLMIRATRVETF
ncbi:MAG TPA: class I SAM-dependent methyltransferase [Kineosporiaceae bacterium]|nr:class I SAM-dependent methyltransferase [Kineosporiaceae bacterium]